jgi:hypothetical protein
VIVAAGIGLGRQALDWWRRPASPEEQGDESLSIAGAASAPVLRFGEMPFAFVRSQLAGDREAAREALRNHCKTAADEALAAMRTHRSRLTPAGPAEASLIRLIDKSPAIESRDGEWMLHEHDGPIPLAVVVGYPDPPPADGESPPAPQFPVSSRVVCWGIALAGCAERPAAGDGAEQNGEPACWTIYTCSHDLTTEVSGAMTMTMLPDLPAELGRSMVVGLKGSACVCGVYGRGSVRHWQDRFDEWFAERNGFREADWQELAGLWHARYEEEAMFVDVNFQVDQGDNMSGMVKVAVKRHSERELDAAEEEAP